MILTLCHENKLVFTNQRFSLILRSQCVSPILLFIHKTYVKYVQKLFLRLIWGRNPFFPFNMIEPEFYSIAISFQKGLVTTMIYMLLM